MPSAPLLPHKAHLKSSQQKQSSGKLNCNSKPRQPRPCPHLMIHFKQQYCVHTMHPQSR